MTSRSELEEELHTLKAENLELKAKLDQFSKVNKWLAEKYKQINVTLSDQRIAADYYYSELQQWKQLHKLAQQSYVSSCEQTHCSQDSSWHSLKILNMMDNLKIAIDCPISLDKLVDPIILPSGVTVSGYLLNILKGKEDPFNKNLIVQHMIPNRLAKQLIEIIDHYECEVCLNETEIIQDLNDGNN